MSCERFETRMNDYLDHALSAPEMDRFEAHLRGCAHCRAVARIFSRQNEVSTDTGLTAAILRQTSGSVCASAQDRLPDLVDGRLDPVESELLTEHAQACRACAPVLAALVDMGPALQSMAQIEPDDVLVDDVLRRTTSVVHEGWLAETLAASVSAWRRLLARPRFAYEAGYAFTVAVVLLMALPISPLRHVPADGLAVLRGEATLEQKSELWRRLRPVRGLGAAALDTGGALGAGVSAEVASRRTQLGRVWPRVGDNANRLGAAMLSMEVETIPVALGALGCDLRLLWDGLNKRLPTEGDLEC